MVGYGLPCYANGEVQDLVPGAKVSDLDVAKALLQELIVSYVRPAHLGEVVGNRLGLPEGGPDAAQGDGDAYAVELALDALEIENIHLRVLLQGLACMGHQPVLLVRIGAMEYVHDPDEVTVLRGLVLHDQHLPHLQRLSEVHSEPRFHHAVAYNSTDVHGRPLYSRLSWAMTVQ